MKISQINIVNFRSYVDTGDIFLSDINVLIGDNNSGKTSIIKAVQLLQSNSDDIYQNVRSGMGASRIDIFLKGVVPGVIPGFNQYEKKSRDVFFSFSMKSTDRRGGELRSYIKSGSIISENYYFPSNEPNNAIVPFLSKRKVSSYIEDVRENSVFSVSTTMGNLAAKLTRVANPGHPAYGKYADACKKILGFVVGNVPSLNGQVPGVYLPDGNTLPISQMGEGVANIVYFLVNLVVSRGKIFLVEEPENDLHPKALRALLDLIRDSSSDNQFIISTHSNIVMTHLCGLPNSKLFRVDVVSNAFPVESKVTEVNETPEARMEILHELGYLFSDFYLWDGWLILEESSAEKIIKDYLIPWFAPKLSRVRTISAGGTSKINPIFHDFQRLVLFSHLQTPYQQRTWVRVDGDSSGCDVVSSLKIKFPDFPEDSIKTFKKSDFELYYPSHFHDEVDRVLGISDRKEKMEEKRQLLNKVISWMDSNKSQAKAEIKVSAEEIIKELQVFESKI